MISREAVIAEARTLIGTPWVHLGRTVHGVDCVGLLRVVCERLGISDYDLKTYPREGNELLREMYRAGGTRIPINAALPADLLLFRPRHVGILSVRDGLPTVIHAHGKRPVLEEELLHELLANRFAAIRMPGVG